MNFCEQCSGSNLSLCCKISKNFYLYIIISIVIGYLAGIYTSKHLYKKYNKNKYY